ANEADTGLHAKWLRRDCVRNAQCARYCLLFAVALARRAPFLSASRCAGGGPILPEPLSQTQDRIAALGSTELTLAESELGVRALSPRSEPPERPLAERRWDFRCDNP